MPNTRDIAKRPRVVEDKKRIGDLEIDLVIGKDHKGALVIIGQNYRNAENGAYRKQISQRSSTKNRRTTEELKTVH